jgi:hypothetical protein
MKLILELDDQLNSKESKAQLHQKQVKKESVRKTRFDEVPHLLDGFRMVNLIKKA